MIRRCALWFLALLPCPLCGGEPPRRDRYGDPLPPRAIARMGTARLRVDQEIRAFAFWPDDRTLAVCCVDGSLCFWERSTGREIRRPRTPLVFVRATVFVPGTKSVALLGKGNKLHLWDTAAAKTVWSEALPDFVRGRDCLVASPDGKLLAVAEEENKVDLYEAVSGRRIRSLKGMKVDTFVFSPDSALLAIASEKPPVQLWDIRSGKKLGELPSPKRFAFYLSIAFSNDGKRAAVGSFYNVVVSEVATRKVICRLEFDYSITHGGLLFAAGGKTLLIMENRGGVHFWDVAAGKERFSRQIAWSPETDLVLSRHGKVLAVADLRGRKFRFIHLLDPATGKDLVPTIDGHLSDLNFIAFSLDGKTLLSSGRQTIREWKTETGEPGRSIPRRLISDDAPVFSADRKRLALPSSDCVYLGRIGQDEHMRSLEYKGKDVLRAAAFSPDGSYLLTAHNRCYPSDSNQRKTVGQDGLHFWDLATGKEIRNIPTSTTDLYSQLVITPNGRTAIAGSRRGMVWREKRMSGSSTDSGAGQLYLWDLPSGRAIRTLEGHRAAIYLLALSGDGRLLLSASAGHNLRLWELASGKTLFTLPVAPTNSPAAISPDGRLLAVGDESTVRLYSTATGKPVLELRGQHSEIRCLAFSPDNRRLASGLRDGTALVWDISAACRAVRPEARRLNAKELESLWTDLADTDALKAHRAIGALIGGGDSTVGMLKRRLHPPQSVDPKRLSKLLVDLDADDFAVRESAMQQLAKLGQRAEPALNAALKDRPSLEARKRIEELLTRTQRREWSSDQLRELRALRVLEQIASAEAREVLQSLATGSIDAWLTQEARLAALRRNIAADDASTKRR